jgi:hypothetical protein
MADSRYRWSGGREHILRIGCDNPIQIIMIAPFFEEANRMRQVLVALMRGLSEQDIGAVLPDLPGTGESLTPLTDVTIAGWRSALTAAASATRGKTILTVSFRSGALIDDAVPAKGHWRCAPETGHRLVRDLMRTRLTSTAAVDAAEDHVAVAGHLVSQSLLDALSSAVPVALPRGGAGVRVARLISDVAEADVRLAGGPIWRRSEPGDDPALRAAILADLIPWAKQCAAS